MEPNTLGTKYDKIAKWWHDTHFNSEYGVSQFERALKFVRRPQTALDVGCGAGGRFVRHLENAGVNVTGVDVSQQMVELAASNHPQQRFYRANIVSWNTTQTFDFIIAWDSLFHLPLKQQEPVLTKLCQMLNKSGVLFYTFGNDEGDHTDTWHNDTYYYSSIGINKNLQLLIDCGLSIMHLELDQIPERHVYVIAVKN